MRALWQRLTGRGMEEISPWVGISLGSLYLVAVVGVGASALHFQRNELFRQQVEDTKEWTQLLARHLSTLAEVDETQYPREIRRAARESGVAFWEIVSPSGKIIAHSDPARVGRKAESLAGSTEPDAPVRSGTVVGQPGMAVLASKVLCVDGPLAGAELRVGVRPRAMAWTQSDIVLGAGCVLLAVLGLFLLTYRRLRRSVQPLAAIRDRLIESGDSVPHRLAALRLNDSYDQISASWNGLIDFLTEMQEQVSRSELVTDVTSAMEGYRSEHLTDLLMRIPFGVLVVDDNQSVAFANRAAAGMLGQTGESLDGRDVAELLDGELRAKLSSSRPPTPGAVLPGGRFTDHAFERGSRPVTLRFWSSPTSGGGKGYLLFVQDVTQAKEAEQARDKFLYHVTHELRTPLTNIRAYAETLSQGVIDDERTIRECYNVIMSETGRLGRLVEDMLNISQLEVGSARLQMGEVQIEEVLRKVVQDNQGSADAKNVDLVLRMPAKAPRVPGDRERLAVVVNNLVGNAIKYTLDGGRVEVKCVVSGSRVEVAVSDTGIGIDVKDQEKVFEKFYRVDSAEVSKIPGTGLGLAIAKETVRAHNGTLNVESTPGQGTTFSMILPALALDQSASDTRL